MLISTRFLAAASALTLAACGDGGAPDTDIAVSDPPSDVAETGEEDSVDPWVLIIESGRWGVLINRAREGAMLKSGADVEREESDVQRIDDNLRFAALDLVRLRDVVCGEGVAAADDPVCAPIQLPYWVLAAPDYSISLNELQARSDWVAEASSALVGVGCKAGEEAVSGTIEGAPPGFCSVE
ncbi:MAG: hypothetical protein AAF719_08515 [Pseudomonadota bacterium]